MSEPYTKAHRLAQTLTEQRDGMGGTTQATAPSAVPCPSPRCQDGGVEVGIGMVNCAVCGGRGYVPRGTPERE